MIKQGNPGYKESSVGNFMKATWSMMSGKPSLTKDDVEKRVIESIEKTLIGTTRYSNEMVMECITQVKAVSAQNQWNNSLNNVALYTLFKTVHEQMQHIQSKWDRSNGILSKFEQCKPTMEEFVKNLLQGCKAVELLLKTFDGWIKGNLHTTVEQHLIDDVARNLKSQNWVVNANAKQALFDKFLLQQLKAENYNAIYFALNKPQIYADRILKVLVSKKLAEMSNDVKDGIVAKVRDSIDVAAKNARNASIHRSSCFFSSLRLDLQKNLRLSGTSDLVANLPLVDEVLMNCDTSAPEIFSSKKHTGVLYKVHE
ncbi:hypothetical protein THRCLA_09423, partial [Thraustotheca clavata]